MIIFWTLKRSNWDQASTPLHVAVEGGHVSVVKELLNNGADTILTTSLLGYDRRGGLNPLELAVERGIDEVAAILRDVKRYCSFGSTRKESRTRIKQRFLS
jgi:hypothetical protein